MSPDKMIDWINNATYDELLRRWRFAPLGDPFFQGKIGDHFNDVMLRRRGEIGDEEHTNASKRVGWKPGVGGPL